MRNFRTMIASLSLVAILSTFVASTAIAGDLTFGDLAKDHYAYSAVQNLVSKGVVDGTKANFNTNANISRAEVAKMVVLAADLKADPNKLSNFPDVSATAWDGKMKEYIDIAFAHGVIGGYQNGNFGPNDPVTRAQLAKMVVNAFNLEVYTPATATFPDLGSEAWVKENVETAYHWSVVNGMKDGTFKPNIPIIRADAAVMINNALSPVERAAVEEDEEPVDNGGTGGDLTVELSSDTPNADNVPQLAVNVPFTTVDFTASSDDVEISQLTVTREGLGDKDDLDKVTVLDAEDNAILVKGRGLTTEGGDDYVTFTFSPALVIPSGSTKSVILAATIANPANSGGLHKLTIDSESDISSDAASVDGDFPIEGENMGISNVDIGELTVTGDTNDSDYNIGEEEVLLAEFDIEAPAAGDGDAELQNIRLKNEGSSGDTGASTFILEIDGEEVATADEMVDDYVSFILDEPYLLEEGNTYTASVKGNIVAEQGENLIFILDEDTDLYATSTKYEGYGLAVDITAFDQVKESSEIGIIGADITVSFEGPAAADMASDNKNYTFAKLKLLAKEDVDFGTIEVEITEVDGAADGVVDVDNLELFDETNNVLYSADDGDGADDTEDAPNTYTFEDVYFKGDTQYEFVIRGDVPNDASAGDSYRVAIDFANASAEWVDSGEDVTMADSLSSLELTGKTMTVADPNLAADVITLQDFSTVGGSTGILMYKSYLEANNVKDIKVSKITIGLAVGSDIEFDQLSQVKLVKIEKDGTETVLDIENSPDGDSVIFSGFSLVVPKGVNNKVTFGVRGDVKDAPDAGDLIIEVDADGYTAKDSDNDTVTGDNLDPDNTDGPIVTIAATGTLTIAPDFSEVGTNANQHALGGQKVLVARYKLDAENEAAKITDWTLDTTGTADSDDVAAVYLYTDKAMTNLVATGTLDGDGNVVYEDLNFVVPEAGATYIYVAVEFKNIGDTGSQTAVSGHTFILDTIAAADLDTIGNSTEDDIAETVTAGASKTTTVYASGITELKNSYTGDLKLTASSEKIFEFSVKAPTHSNVIEGEPVKTYMDTITLTLNGAEIDSVEDDVTAGKVGITALSIERLDQSTDGEVEVALADGLDGDTTVEIDLATLFANDDSILPGVTAKYAVYATITDVDDNESLQAEINDVDGGDITWITLNQDADADNVGEDVAVGSVLIQGVTRLQGHTLSQSE